MTDISYNLNQLRSKIQHTAALCGRTNDRVCLLAVSKGHAFEKIIEAYKHQQTDFGENYLQDALPKILAAKENNLSINWHYIGQLQSNKCKAIAENFAWVHSLSSLKHAHKINHAREASGLTPINICIQVQFEHAPQRGGMPFNQVDAFIASIRPLSSLQLRGLMCVLPQTWSPAQIQQGYSDLQQLFSKLHQQYEAFDTLSAGMSNDYIQAIQNGSTMVRIGSGIFGER